MPRPLSRVHAPCLAASVGAGADLGVMPPTTTPPHSQSQTSGNCSGRHRRGGAGLPVGGFSQAAGIPSSSEVEARPREMH